MEYKDINDYELLYMIKENSDESIELLFQKYQPLIKKYIYKWWPTLQQFHLEKRDVEQDMYCAFFSALSNYDEVLNSSLYTYLNHVFEKTIANIIRLETLSKNQIYKHSVSLNNNFSEETEYQNFFADGTMDVCALADAFFLQEDIYTFCYTLPINQAEIFELYLNQYKVRDIAKFLSSKPRNISNKLIRIRKKLKRYLEKLNYVV